MTDKNLHGWSQIYQLLQNTSEQLDFSYHTEPLVIARVKQALANIVAVKELIHPRDSRVGRVSLTSKLKLIKIGLTGLESALLNKNIHGNRAEAVITRFKNDTNELIKLVLSKSSIDEAKRAVALVANPDLKEKLTEAIANDTSMRFKFEEDHVLQYARIEDANSEFKLEGDKFRSWLASRKLGKKPRVLFRRISLVVLADPTIPSARLARTDINYVIMASVLVLKKQRVAIIHDPDKSAEPKFNEIIVKAGDKYDNVFVNVMRESTSHKEYMLIKDYPTLKLVWLLESDHYAKIGGFRVKEIGFPWNM